MAGPGGTAPKVDGKPDAIPTWALQLAKGGGVAGVAVLLWLMFLQPMREDFLAFRSEVASKLDRVANEFGSKMDKVASEVSGIRELISGELRQRITRNEQRDQEIMRRLDAVEKDVKELSKK